jgi:hypothetical protein
MMTSKYTKLIALSAVLFSVTLFTLPVVKEYVCQTTSAVTGGDCSPDQLNTPSWWDWIISSESSKFHFFQLLELIHNYDVSASISDNQELRQHS